MRAYINGHEGTDWNWVMGCVQTIIDQTASKLGRNLTHLIPLTFSFDTRGDHGLQKGLLTRFSEVRNNPQHVKPGDIYLCNTRNTSGLDLHWNRYSGKR
ncbi:MAG TPA: hypothetical protein VK014_03935 [Cyclobacteriaceae bacterium]|nr:hypothetical protein [Cyclobacteriaceae bacterium]